MKNVIDYLYHKVENYPDRIVYNFVDTDKDPFEIESVTARQLLEKSQDIAWALRKKGSKKGERAIILCMQDAGTIYAILGCMMAGVIFTVIPPPIDEGKLQRFISVLKSCKPRFLISNYGLEQTSESDAKKTIVKQALLEALSLKRIYTDKVPQREENCDFVSPGYDDLIYLQYTSGSTSDPKGVMVTSGNLTSCLAYSRSTYDYSTGHILISWVPFYHNIGLVSGIFLPLTAEQGSIYFISPLQFIKDPRVWLKAISYFKANSSIGPNSAFEICTKLVRKEDAKNYDLSNVDQLLSGSEFVHVETIEKFCSLFDIKQSVFSSGYGLSECVCVATVALDSLKYLSVDVDAYQSGMLVPTSSGSPKRIVSLGRPIGALKVLTVKEDGALCAENEIGEVYLQGESVCQGYWKNPIESEVFKATIQGQDGLFFRTGDMGAICEGELYLTGRLKEMIIVNGKNIFPSDISMLLRHSCPDVPEEAMSVFSVQTNTGETPVLCLESEERSYEPLVRDINRAMAESFEFSFSDIVFVRIDTLPRTDNRKIRTNAVKQYYEQNKLEVIYSTKTSGSNGISEIAVRKKLSKNASVKTIKESIRNVFRKYTDFSDFDDKTDFMELGVDSFTAVEMLNELETVSGLEIDIRYIGDSLSINSLAKHIKRLLAGEVPDMVDWKEEIKLAEDIRPQAGYTVPPEYCSKVFLTGSTGFLGAYLIRSLLTQRKDKNTTIYCHARAESDELAMDRIIKNMKYFKCWDERFRDRIIAVPGDLNKIYLGLDRERYNSLADEIEVVYHNGAILNFLYSYNQMRQTNVGGTIEALRFAAHGNPKYFHYVSSYSVFDNPSHFGKVVPESDPLSSPDGYFLGYSETKWVAEKLVAEAANRGLRTAVYRPGEITGGTREGVWKLEDMISRTLVGCIQMRAMPEMDVSLPLTPVDFVSKAIAHISTQSKAIGRQFNLVNKHLTNTRAIGAFIRKAGFRFVILPYEEWCKVLAEIPPAENVLSILSRLFTDKRGDGENLMERYGNNQAKLDTSNTDELLQDSGIECPPLGKRYFFKYLKMYMKAGYISKKRKGVKNVK